MITKEQVLEVLKKSLTEDNRDKIGLLISKIEIMSEDELRSVLQTRKIATVREVKKFVKNELKDKTNTLDKFKELNDLVSYGVTGKTIHIHVVPKDARSLLTREGLKKAELALIDAVEKIKELIQNDKTYGRIENVYAVSGIISGPVARWFKNIGFDVKTLPINEAKTDSELKKFYNRFKEQKKLGRAVLTTEKLITNEWEQQKEKQKESLGVPVKLNEFVESLKELSATDKEIVENDNDLQEGKKIEDKAKNREGI